MKHFALHLRLLLAVLCGTGVSPVLAVSISSEKIDTFMTLPDWMPTSVDAEHTFGSDERTNVSRRVTADTLAAVESIFDAYHERVFFTSEGRSNNWDVAEFGPRPTSESSLANVSVTNRDSFRVYAYGVSTNDTPRGIRAVPDTRRLVEYGNLIGLAAKLRDDVFDADWHPHGVLETDGIFMEYRPTWAPRESGYYDEYRQVYIGSSAMPGNLRPDEFDWRSGIPYLDEWAVTNCCLPFAECCGSDVFKDGQGYALSTRAYLHRRWLERIDCGHLSFDSTSGGHSYLRRLDDSRPWLPESTVSQVIDSKFPSGSAESGIMNFTHRLVPDDYMVYDVETREELAVSRPVTVDFSGTREEGAVVPWPEHEEYRYSTLVSYDFDIGSGKLKSVKLRCEDVDDELESHDEQTVGPPPEGTVRHEVQPNPDYEMYWAPFGYVTSYYDPPGWTWHGTYAQLVVNYYKLVVITNSVTTNSSLLATESRALSLVDRTYELAPRCPFAAGYPVCSETRNTYLYGRAEYGCTAPLSFTSYGDWTGSGSHLECYFGNDYPVTPEGWELVYSTNFVNTTVIGTNYDLRVRYRSTGIVADAGCGATAYGVGLEYDGPAEQETSDHERYYHTLFADWGGATLVSYDIDTGNADSVGLYVGVSEDAYVSLSLSVEQRLSRTFTTAPSYSAVDRCYPYYGPGTLSFATGRVKESHCTLGCCLVSVNGGWWTPITDIEQALDWGTVKDIADTPLYTVKSAQISNNAGVIRAISDAIGSGGWAQTKLGTLVRAAGCDVAKLEPTIGLIGNIDNVGGYSGAVLSIDIRDQQPSTNKWPEHIEFTFGLQNAREDPQLVVEATSDPFAADVLLTDPLISTEWKWKALKASSDE